MFTTVVKNLKIFSLPATIWALGFASMFSNASSVIISSLSPALIIDILGGDERHLGYVRGTTEALAYFVKLFAGMISDFFGKRKIIVLIGYAASAFAKPIYATTKTILMYITAQTIDRITNGLRDTPRDAMVADFSPNGMKGESFGLRQGLSALGSTIGAYFAYRLMMYVGGSTADMVRSAYWFSIIPILLCILIIYFFTKEPKDIPQLSKRTGFPIKKEDLKELGTDYWFFMFVVLIFMITRSSESFLVLRAKSVGLIEYQHPLVLAVLYLFTSPSAKFFGSLSDKINRKICLIIGFIFAAIAYYILSISDSISMVFFGVVIYGLHYGTVQTVLFSMVSDYAPKHIKGTSFGILNFVCAIGMCISSFIQGEIWHRYGPVYTYNIALCLTLISILFLFFVKPKKNIN